MRNDDDSNSDPKDDCTVPTSLPPEELSKYRVLSDPHLENDIAAYVEGQADDETVAHVERIRDELVLGTRYEIFDVTTDKDRWWVITNLTNLYSQRHFPSLDYTLSFHIGLMMRLQSRPEGARSDDPTPFDEVFRRQEQAKDRHDRAAEPEDFQAVGMHLRECLLSLIAALRRRVPLTGKAQPPQAGNFVAWSEHLIGELCGGEENKALRRYLKRTAKDTWQLVNWLTHDQNAGERASSIAIHACDTVVGHSFQLVQRQRADGKRCPLCGSQKIRSHFDPFIGDDGEYYLSCAACEWTSHPGKDPAHPPELEGDA